MATLIGTASNNLLRGTWADDTINGGIGADTMYGGSGNDVYYVDNILDVVYETPIYNNTAIQLASVAASGTLGNGASGGFAITMNYNGNLVGFYTNADNLVAGYSNGAHELDVKNMATGAVIPAMTQAGNLPATGGGGAEWGYEQMHMTPDGTFVVYCSTSVGIIPSVDSSTDADIFVKNLVTGAVTIESQPTGSGVSNYHASAPNISDNGRYVTFTQMDNLVNTLDVNSSSNSDVYWRDRVTGTLKMVSGEFDGSYQGDSDSDNASVTNDGRFVLFESTSGNLVSVGDTNNASDLFIRDMVADTITLVTASAVTAGVSANGSSYQGQITGDGHYIVYASRADDLILGDSGEGIFRQDLITGDTIRVNTTAAGMAANRMGYHPQITPDGRYVVFESTATDLVSISNDSNAIGKVFVKDLVTGAVEMVSRTTTGLLDTTNSYYAPQISDDGRYIAFFTQNALVSADANANEDVYRVPNPLYTPTDEIRSTVSYILPTAVENLSLLNSANINGTGNASANLITGNAGTNTLDGLAGNDNLKGLAGDDNLLGGSGADSLDGGLGNDTMTGGDGSDRYYVDSISDAVIETNATSSMGGYDTVVSYLGAYTLGNNVERGQIAVTSAANLTGNSQANILTGNSSANILTGGGGNDTLSGGAGNDSLYGGAGNDSMAGGDGNDTYSVDSAGDIVNETSGVAATGGIDIVYSFLGAYTLGTNIENGRIVTTTSGNLTGNALSNVFFAGVGANVINGGSGTEIDTVSYANGVSGATGVTVSLANTSSQVTGGSGSDTLLKIENLTGSAYADNLRGSVGNNSLNGGAGNDVLNGGLGNDVLIGGAGADIYVFNTVLSASTNKDIIADFSVVDDSIKLENSGAGLFSMLSLGTLSVGAFHSGIVNVATEADDRVIYNTSTGALYYDADGNAGAAPPIQFAIIGTSTHAALGNTDFVVI